MGGFQGEPGADREAKKTEAGRSLGDIGGPGLDCQRL